MNTIQKRFLLFLIGCIGTRLAFTFLAKEISLSYLPYLGYVALLPVIGWFYIIFIGSRDTGAEVFGEKIWWKNLRIFHMTLYTAFAYLAINKNKDAWLVLLGDTLFGLSLFILHHYEEGNFSKLL
jgi:hypothetical protein